VQRTSLLGQAAHRDRAARELLGDEHPLVHVLQRTAAAVRQSLMVGVIALGAGTALFEGVHAALAVVASAAAVEVGLALQFACLRFRARERACDLIIQGRADLPLDAVRRERARLLDRGHCDDLADWVDRTCTVAERSLRSHQPPPFFSGRVIVAVHAELAEIAERLREDAPGVRGVALVERLLSEGGSPLHGGSVAALREELRRIRFMLGT
jgi:hypothetical protein